MLLNCANLWRILAPSTLFAGACLTKGKKTAKAQKTRKPNLHSTNEGSWMAASNKFDKAKTRSEALLERHCHIQVLDH